MKQIIRETLDQKLTGETYKAEDTSKWTKEIADEIRDKLKGVLVPLAILKPLTDTACSLQRSILIVIST
jgi:hypothetical protein